MKTFFGVKVWRGGFPAERFEADVPTRRTTQEPRLWGLWLLWTQRRRGWRSGGCVWSCSAGASPAPRPPRWRRSVRWTEPAEEERGETQGWSSRNQENISCFSERSWGWGDLLESVRCRLGLHRESRGRPENMGAWWGCRSSDNTESCCAWAGCSSEEMAWSSHSGLKEFTAGMRTLSNANIRWESVFWEFLTFVGDRGEFLWDVSKVHIVCVNDLWERTTIRLRNYLQNEFVEQNKTNAHQWRLPEQRVQLGRPGPPWNWDGWTSSWRCASGREQEIIEILRWCCQFNLWSDTKSHTQAGINDTIQMQIRSDQTISYSVQW